MSYFSSFEIIAENLVPTKIIPAGPSNPFALQGYWLQITNISINNEHVPVSISFLETTGFKSPTDVPNAEYIDADGQVNIYDKFLGGPFPGFKDQIIPAGKTVIFGVQALPRPPSADAVSFPQAGTGWRGVVGIISSRQDLLTATATQRLVYYAGTNFKAPIISACVYPVPRL